MAPDFVLTATGSGREVSPGAGRIPLVPADQTGRVTRDYGAYLVPMIVVMGGGGKALGRNYSGLDLTAAAFESLRRA